MHYFVMVSYTFVVPFQIYLGFFVEIGWKSIGCHSSRPLAGPVQNEENEEHPMDFDRPQAGQPVENLSGH